MILRSYHVICSKFCYCSIFLFLKLCAAFDRLDIIHFSQSSKKAFLVAMKRPIQKFFSRCYCCDFFFYFISHFQPNVKLFFSTVTLIPLIDKSIICVFQTGLSSQAIRFDDENTLFYGSEHYHRSSGQNSDPAWLILNCATLKTREAIVASLIFCHHYYHQ